jgi:polyisoprenyl-phosphate glycosyltransferase
MTNNISILIPVFNEEGNLVPLVTAIDDAFAFIRNCEYEIFFVDDGSTDNTLLQIKDIATCHHNVSYISFSRNFGKDAALLAGFQHIISDAVITIDSDLQHPPELIPTLVDHWREGYDIVYTYRNEKNIHANAFTQITSQLFYWLISKLADVRLEDGLSDFKIIDKKVVSVIKTLKEDAPFFRGLFKWVGFRQKGITYTPKPRLKGVTKYSTKALFSFALQNITSFSTKPLTSAIYIGFFTSFLSLLYIPYVLYSLLKGVTISGWASTIVTIAFFGGMQLIVMGIIGLYLGKLFMQAKNRPQYIVKESAKKVKKLFITEKYEEDKAMDSFG